jgi:hypothetical protein
LRLIDASRCGIVGILPAPLAVGRQRRYDGQAK